MGWFVSDEREAVELGECRCAGTPHDHDTVWLRAELGPDAGFAANVAVDRLLSDARASGRTEIANAEFKEPLGRIYAQYGIADWTFLDDDGEPVPVTQENIARLSWAVVFPIAERGDVLYGPALLAPLVAQASKSSRNGATSTSAPTKSSAARPKRSRPSTTASTPRRR